MPKFCTNCGASLEDESAFCINCGTPADDVSPSGTVVIPAASSAPNVTPAPGFEPSPGPFSPSTRPAPNVGQTFNQQPPMYAAVPADAPMQQQGKKKPNVGLICAIVVVVVALVAAIVVMVFVLGGQGGSGTSAASSAASVSGASASSEASTSSGTTKTSEEYSTAMNIYEKMGALDERIGTCATEFNNNWSKSSRSLREGYASSANSVRDEAMGMINTISAITSGGAHGLSSEDHGHLRELANDLYNRINVICESWSRSLSYSDPSAHQDYVLAPIAADNDGGVNIYYRHFKENYPNWKPTP